MCLASENSGNMDSVIASGAGNDDKSFSIECNEKPLLCTNSLKSASLIRNCQDETEKKMANDQYLFIYIFHLY